MAGAGIHRQTPPLMTTRLEGTVLVKGPAGRNKTACLQGKRCWNRLNVVVPVLNMSVALVLIVSDGQPAGAGALIGQQNADHWRS